MPSVAALIMWQRWQSTFWQWLPPIFLTFKISPVAGCAILCVEPFAERHLLGIIRIGGTVDAGVSYKIGANYNHNDGAAYGEYLFKVWNHGVISI